MKLRTFILAGVALAALGTAPASATEAMGWYLGLGAGWDHLNAVKMTSNFPFTLHAPYSDSALVVGSFGYRFENNVRIEFETGYSSHDIEKFGGVSGSTDIKSALVDFVYDVDLGGPWSVSLGAGFGGANAGEHLAAAPPPPGLFFVHGSHVVFAWQGIAGINYDIDPNLEIFADFRYRETQADHNYFSSFVAFNPVRVYKLDEQVGLFGIRWYPDEAPPPPPPPPPPAVPPPPPAPVKTFIVFFDFDKSNLTAEAQSVVGEAVKTAKTNGFVKVLVTGHTDTVGSDSYNQGLSVRRAEAVKDEMVREGMDGSTIAIEGKSFHDPLVPTGPGVREPQNRRAVIDLGG